MKLSLVIPSRSLDDPKLKELLASIETQDFPKDEMEVLVITEGTSESAKAIGIRRAKGEVIGILASDNELVNTFALRQLYDVAQEHGAAQPIMYSHIKSDDILNRYFALIGGNDPLSFYMQKNDKVSYGYSKHNAWYETTVGDNGYFVKKSLIELTDLNNYFHIDNAVETDSCPRILNFTIWHKTGGNIFHFFAKRYRYGLQHAFNPNRRWHLVDFSKPKDIARLIWFIVATLTVIQPLSLSIRGWLKIRDVAWFLHYPVCVMTLGTYTILVIHHLLRRIFPSSSAPMDVQTA